MLSKQIGINYIVNNYLFDLYTIQNTNLDDSLININTIYNIDNTFLTLFYLLVKNVLNLLISDSLSTICSITNKSSSYIYETNGNLTSIFSDKKNSTYVIPLSSNIFVFTNNNYQECDNLNSSNNIYFNKSLLLCVGEIKKNVINYLNSYFDKYKINIVGNLDNQLLNVIDYNNLLNFSLCLWVIL